VVHETDGAERVPASLRRTAAVVVAVLVLAGLTGELVYRGAYGTFAWWSDPARISYCGRDYLPSAMTVTHARIEHERAALLKDPPYPVVTVAKVPPVIGRPLLASVTPEVRRAGSQLPCAMVVYLETGPDAYRPYVISGGP